MQTAEHAHTEAVGARDTALDQFAWIMSTYLADAVELGVSVDADRVRPTLDLARQLPATCQPSDSGPPNWSVR